MSETIRGLGENGEHFHMENKLKGSLIDTREVVSRVTNYYYTIVQTTLYITVGFFLSIYPPPPLPTSRSLHQRL